MDWIAKNANSITAVSTVIYTIATIFLVTIAVQAKNSWEKEFKYKKKYEIYTESYNLLKKIQTKLMNNGNNEKFNEFIEYYERNMLCFSKNLQEKIDDFRIKYHSFLIKDLYNFVQDIEKIMKDELNLKED